MTNKEEIKRELQALKQKHNALKAVHNMCTSDLKQANERLRELGEKPYATTHCTGEGLIAADQNGHITNMNPVAENLCGWTLKNAAGRPLTEVFRLVNPDTGEPLYNQVNTVMKGKTEFRFAQNTVLVSRQGMEHKISGRVSAVENINKEVKGVDIVFSNQTNEPANVNRLPKSREERLDLAMMVKNEGVWDWNLINDNTYFDARYYTMAGYEPDEFPQTFDSWAEHVHPDDLKPAQEAINEYLSGASENYEKEFRFKHKNGSWIWIQGRGKIVERDTDGKPLRMIGTHTDITSRKQAELALKENLIRLDATLNATADGLLASEKMGKVIFHNRQFQRMWHIPKSIIESGSDNELIGYVLDQLDDPEAFTKKVRDLYNSDKESFDVLHFKDGRVFERYSYPLEVKENNSKGRVWSFRDITERKRYETELKQEKERFAKIMLTAPAAICMFCKKQDGPAYFSFVDPSIENIYGYNREEILNDISLVTGNIHPDDYKRIFRELSESANNLTRWDSTYRFSNPRKGMVWLENHFIPEREEDGTTTWYGFINDITEQKQKDIKEKVLYDIANETFVKSDLKDLAVSIKKILTRLIDTSNFYIAIYDRNNCMLSTPYEHDEKDNIEKWPAEKSMTGLVIRHKKTLLMKKPDIEKLIEQGVIDQIGNMCEVWLGVPLISGQEAIGAVVVQHYENPDVFDEGSKEVLEYVSRQISLAIQRSKTIQHLMAAKERAQESDRLKSAFLANISHEIRTPMNSILGFAELLEKPQFTGGQKSHFIDTIQKSGERMLNLINDIIDISKIESGQMTVNEERVDINETMQFMMDLFSAEFQKNKPDVELKLNIPKKSIIIKTDKEKLHSILINLIKNAEKFTTEGFVEFGYRKEGELLIFFVRDTGYGIPAEKQARMFERFVQANTSLSRPHEGSGLGLSITKAFVELLGGNINVESRPGKGSVFYFSLPAKCEKKQIQEPENNNLQSTKTPSSQYSGYVPRILVAEDDKESYKLIYYILAGKNIELHHAGTGEDAVRACSETQDFDLILMDVKMPGVDGLMATRQIREFNKDVPIIAQTAHALEGDREKALDAGCNDYIPKPISRDNLLALIEKYLSR